MTISRSWIGMSLGAVVLAMFVLDVQQVGFSIQISNGEAEVTAGAHPVFLGASVLGLVFYWAFMRSDFSPTFHKTPTLKRRLAAFGLDFVFSLFCTAPLGGLFMLVVEFVRIGVFHWQFFREETVWTDTAIGLSVVAINMLVLVLYFAYPLTRARPTIGCYLVGTILVRDDQLVRLPIREALARTVLEFLGLCSWPVMLFVGRDRHGQTWYDRATGYSVVCFRGEAYLKR